MDRWVVHHSARDADSALDLAASTVAQRRLTLPEPEMCAPRDSNPEPVD